MTTFDQPDAGLLVEHMLPSLLGMSYSLSQEPEDRTMFFGELGTMLESLHGRITIISSPPRANQADSPYPWLWRHVSHFRVGAKSHAVQHAKLWAFHWKVGDVEHLELRVSSTNLTTQAFTDQVQAGWGVSLRLGQRNSQTTRRTWGELIPFLKELGASAGDVAATRIARLSALLGRVECPAGVTFVASIPGSKSAARQIRKFEPSELHILTPTVGEWSERTLSAWSADVGVVLRKVHLKWISKMHPWAATTGWALSNDASERLKQSGVQVECMPNDVRFTVQHRDGDPRWSHAKLYLMRSRRKYQLLVTSANWSVAAWGAGKSPPRNFELGVAIETEWAELESMCEAFEPPDTVPFCVERSGDDDRFSSLEWAEASWDGRQVILRVRSAKPDAPIAVTIVFADGDKEDLVLVDESTTMSWTDADNTPLIVQFTQEAEMLAVCIVDLRPPAKLAKTPLPEVDPDLMADLREAFLLQRYGGAAVDHDCISGMGGGQGQRAVSAPTTDYSVKAWLDARAAFHVVDQWRTALAEAQADPALFECVRADGKCLRALYARREGPAAALAAQELGWRLDEEA